MLWDVNQKNPFWTLYEENNGKSKRIWDEPFVLNNVDMLYDVLVMTCGAVAPSKNLAEILKAQPTKEDNKFVNRQSSKVSIEAPQDIQSNPSSTVEKAIADNLSNPATDIRPNNNFPPAPNQNPGPAFVYQPNVSIPVNPMTGLPVPAYTMGMPVPPLPQQIPLPSVLGQTPVFFA